MCFKSIPVLNNYKMSTGICNWSIESNGMNLGTPKFSLHRTALEFSSGMFVFNFEILTKLQFLPFLVWLALTFWKLTTLTMNYQKAYMNQIFSSSLMGQVAEMWRNQFLCDAIIRTGSTDTKVWGRNQSGII